MDLIARRWRDAVGTELARRSEPEALKDGVLTVRVTDAVWGKSIYKLQHEIVPAVNAVLGGRLVRRINFTKKSRLQRPAPTETPEASLRDNAEPPPSVVRAAANIEDDELRSMVLASAARYLAAKDRRKRKRR